MNPDDLITTVNIADEYYSIGGTGHYDTTTLDTLTGTFNNKGSKYLQDEYVEGDITITQDGEDIKLGETIARQTLEIESLTDILTEMVATKNFDVDMNISKRVEQKRFLKKLGEDPSDI